MISRPDERFSDLRPRRQGLYLLSLPSPWVKPPLSYCRRVDARGLDRILWKLNVTNLAITILIILATALVRSYGEMDDPADTRNGLPRRIACRGISIINGGR